MKKFIILVLIGLVIFISGCATQSNNTSNTTQQNDTTNQITGNETTDKLSDSDLKIISIEQEKDYSGKNIRYSPYLEIKIPENYYNPERNDSKSIKCTMTVDGRLVSEYYYDRSQLVHIRLYNKLDTWGLPRMNTSEVGICCENICKTQVVESV